MCAARKDKLSQVKEGQGSGLGTDMEMSNGEQGGCVAVKEKHNVELEIGQPSLASRANDINKAQVSIRSKQACKLHW